MNDAITHISDTAYWIAGYRALETQRPDAAFNDHLAARLAGDRGRDMVATAPFPEAMAFAMTVRTAAIDKLIQLAIGRGIDTVVNLAAGLDTRPYRLQLPPTLLWIEVDLPGVIDYKNTMLKEERPHCRLERIAANLTDVKSRDTLFTALGNHGKNMLVVSEGLIGYLTREEASALSKAIFNVPSFAYWIQDYSQGKLRRHHKKDLQKKVAAAPLRFEEKNPLKLFGSDGWKVVHNLHILDEADRIGRTLPVKNMGFPWTLLFKLFPRTIRRMGNRTHGYVMLGKM